jgi:hypothetical protein
MARTQKAEGARTPPVWPLPLERRPIGSDRKGFRRDAAGFEEFPDLQNFGFRQAVTGVMEGGLLSFERYLDPAARRVFDVGAQFGQNVAYGFEIDIGAYGMGKQRMENFSMMVIHLSPQRMTIVRRGAYAANIWRR